LLAAHELHANQKTNSKHMWISFIFMSKRTRSNDIPEAFMTLFYKNINEHRLHSHMSTHAWTHTHAHTRTHTHTHTHTIPACWMAFDCSLHLFRKSRTSQPISVLPPVPFFTLKVISFCRWSISLYSPHLKSRHRLVWPQLPGVNHKHSNYLINRGPLLNQHGGPAWPGFVLQRNTLIHTDIQVQVSATTDSKKCTRMMN